MSVYTLSTMSDDGQCWNTEETEKKEVLTRNETDIYALPRPIKSVLHIDAKSSRISEKTFDTRDLCNVKELVLSHTHIQELPKNFTLNLENLKVLNLEGNELLKLPESLNKLCLLESLNVSCNALDQIPDDIIHLQSLKYLNISNNSISKLPDSICSLANLKILYLSDNVLTSLSKNIGALTNLEFLDVSKNSLSGFPDSICKLRNLMYLNISQNFLSKLPDFSENVKLNTFIASYNRFVNVPDCIIFKLHNLANLDLSYNSIMFFDTPPKSVNKLVKLNISNNVFHDIPEWLFSEKCRCLNELNISNNKNMIGTSEMSFYSKSGNKTGVSTTLKILKASNCCFSSSSVKFLHGLKGLEYLVLGTDVPSIKHNHFANILYSLPTKTLNTCTNLKHLIMSGVRLSNLPDDVSDMSAKLEILDVSENELEALPNTFCKLVRLRKLKISNNLLQSLPPDFGQLATLEELRLDGNKLSWLPESFKKLLNLKLLDLYNNHFETFPNIALENLEALDLEYNCFNTCDITDQSLTAFLDKYRTLKENLRCVGVCGVALREDNQKPEEHDDISEQENYPVENLSSDESEDGWEEPVEQKCQDTVGKVTGIFEENWDDSNDESDNNFDPRYMHNFSKQGSYGPALLVYDTGTTAPDHFCPADCHSQPILRSRRHQNVREYVVGQFEDADI